MANLKDIGYGVGKYLVASDASSLPDIGTNRQNIDLLNFKVATNNAYALYNFKDGMIDAYQTEGGVDATTSTNEAYDSTNKLYSPSVVASTTTAFTSTGAATLYWSNWDNFCYNSDCRRWWRGRLPAGWWWRRWRCSPRYGLYPCSRYCL